MTTWRRATTPDLFPETDERTEGVGQSDAAYAEAAAEEMPFTHSHAGIIGD